MRKFHVADAASGCNNTLDCVCAVICRAINTLARVGRGDVLSLSVSNVADSLTDRVSHGHTPSSSPDIIPPPVPICPLVVRSTYDSDLGCDKLSPRNVVS